MAGVTLYEGKCHCGAIGFRYRTALTPRKWSVRACQCSFCRTHGALSTSDPGGSLEFVEHELGATHRYRFGQKTADFLLCRHCGAFVGVIMPSGSGPIGIINVRVLLSLAAELPEPAPMNYEGETATDRSTRRAQRWTPVVGR